LRRLPDKYDSGSDRWAINLGSSVKALLEVIPDFHLRVLTIRDDGHDVMGVTPRRETQGSVLKREDVMGSVSEPCTISPQALGPPLVEVTAGVSVEQKISISNLTECMGNNLRFP
jgi:hypothetical protein